MAEAPIVRRRGRRLRSPENIRALAAHTARQIEMGTIDLQQAEALLRSCQVLLQCIRLQADDRVAVLHKRVLAMQASMEQLREARARTIELPPAHSVTEPEPSDGEDR